MTSSNEELCRALMRADTEVDVVQVLQEAGYWDDPLVWRLVGDIENNYSAIGNQQSEAIAALIEKIINGVDARLLNACLEAGIDPESPEAPRTIREAVARFYEDKSNPNPDVDGRVSSWDDNKATAEGRLLTVAATGNAPSSGGMPSLSIADQGEGQEPDRFPDTFLSLQAKNKLRVHFVQGKFNMGGTGALQFCGGEHNLELIVSRRNPALLPAGASGRCRQWGFTIVKRHWPDDGARSSIFSYLAPVGATATKPGDVLSFAAESWPIFPEANKDIRDAYARPAPYGSLVKLYEYALPGTRSNVVLAGGGLLSRLDLGMPELGLPVRLFECRQNYKGHSGSFATNILGLATRLQKDKKDNLEDGFPISTVINLDGHQVKVRAFAFKPNKAKDYRTRQGVLFAVNGQTHATFPIDFFRRKAVGMSYLADSLLVLVDCTAIDGQMREDLFMNSRDRLRDTALAARLERELEDWLKEDPALRELRNRRRQEELSEKLSDSKPLTNVLQDILKSSPMLAKMFLMGGKVSSPFPPSQGTGDGSAGEFHGKTYPTYFRFKGHADGELLTREAHIDSRCRVALETDAEDEYFMRELDPGASRLLQVVAEEELEVQDWSMRGPRSGIVQLTLNHLPPCAVPGGELHYILEVTDPSRIDVFANEFVLKVKPPSNHGGGGGGHATSHNAGSGTSGGSSNLALPNIVEVHDNEWTTRGFTDLTALKVKNAGTEEDAEGEKSADVYDFYVNVDNKYLRSVQKESKIDPKLLKAKFVYGNVLVGLALLQDGDLAKKAADGVDVDQSTSEVDDSERLVERTTRALAPILLPMLETIGALDVDED